ncbi:MAG: hypothetical protein ACKO26_10740, partial [Planctomycetota bacterium]
VWWQQLQRCHTLSNLIASPGNGSIFEVQRRLVGSKNASVTAPLKNNIKRDEAGGIIPPASSLSNDINQKRK